MSALARKAIETRLIAELRRAPADATITTAELRRRIAEELGTCGAADLAQAVQALRYQGKIAWDRLALAPSMIATPAPPAQRDVRAPEDGGVVAPPPPSSTAAPPQPATSLELYALLMAEGARRGLNQSAVSRQAFGNEMQMWAMKRSASAVKPGTAAKARAWLAGPGDDDGAEDEYPGEVNDCDTGRKGNDPEARVRPSDAAGAAQARPHAKAPGGWSKASNIAGARPQPAPEHEPEVARQVREESNALADRRRIARSTSTVRQPLELAKYGVPDMTLSEAVGTMLTDTPRAVLLAVQRKHPELWRRCVLLGRRRGQSPMVTLYTALERGLGEIEQLHSEPA